MIDPEAIARLITEDPDGTADSGKMSQKEAGYMLPKDESLRSKATGLFCCAKCDMFEKPNGCKGVAGFIEPGACCNNYKSDQAVPPDADVVQQ